MGDANNPRLGGQTLDPTAVYRSLESKKASLHARCHANTQLCFHLTSHGEWSGRMSNEPCSRSLKCSYGVETGSLHLFSPIHRGYDILSLSYEGVPYSCITYHTEEDFYSSQESFSPACLSLATEDATKT